MHPGENCFHFLARFFPPSFKRAVRYGSLLFIINSDRVYLPIFLLQFLFSKSKNPKFFIMNVLRSSLFLSAYCTTAWMSLCGWNQIRVKSKSETPENLLTPISAKLDMPQTRLQYLLHGWIAGLSLAIERPGRAVELASYCATYAAESIFRFCENRGWVSVSPALNSLILAFSTAFAVHYYEQQPKMLIKWLFKLSH